MSAEIATPPPRADLERAWVYRALAKLFQAPDSQRLAELRETELPQLRRALQVLGAGEALEQAAGRLARQLGETDAIALAEAHLHVFDASAGGSCPPHETALVPDTASEQMTRTYALADIAGFYRAFGVELTPGGERPDHISAELEFMHLLALKQCVGREVGDAAEQLAVCHDAGTSFLGDHLGRFAPRLAERLEETAGESVYATAGRLLADFVAFDAAPDASPRGSAQ